MVFNPWPKGLLKIKITLYISKCHEESCFQMQTLASMYMISGWTLLSLQNHVKNVHYIQSYPHPNSYPKEDLYRSTIHIAHPMCLMIGYYNLCPILCMLVHIDVTIFELKTDYSCHKLIFINLVKSTLD